ncbi:MAG: hypothetical protein K2G25_00915 [Oscillospiraceae bacterium]|nr:hypothetical protein [Oscillospiraceae bacterium]
MTETKICALDSSELSKQEHKNSQCSEDVYKGKKTRKINTYDKETGYHITSVFPVLNQEEYKEQAVSITEEIIALMNNKYQL